MCDIIEKEAGDTVWECRETAYDYETTASSYLLHLIRLVFYCMSVIVQQSVVSSA